jgi:nitronate monooxygenase
MDGLFGGLGLAVPVVAAPMAGGPSTPALVAAVGGAGGLGLVPAGYRDAGYLREQIGAVRALTDRPFGVNVFVPGSVEVDHAALAAYAASLAPDAAALGVEPGEPRWDDDDYAAKLDLLAEEAVPLVSFAFGCPAARDVARLRRAGSAVLVTVTTAAEAATAAAAGVDALCVQGIEAGAHRGSFEDGPTDQALPLLALLAEVRAAVDLPLLATGGLMSGADIAAALAAGADAGQLGTAFLCCPEAGTSATHRQALLGGAYTETAYTRAFTGRTARGLANAFLREHSAAAPAGYPWVHHLTRPLRTAAATRGDADRLHLWAGANWQRIRPMPAADLVATLAAEL